MLFCQYKNQSSRIILFVLTGFVARGACMCTYVCMCGVSGESIFCATCTHAYIIYMRVQR